MMLKVVAIIQARVGSTRLPAKVLMSIQGEKMLACVVSRVRLATTLDEVVVAIPDNKSEDVLYNLCSKQGWSCYRGEELDVLDRFYQTALITRADIIVRITADCPLIDPKLIDAVVNRFLFLHPYVDYVSNILPRTYPRGLDVEAMSMDVLKSEWEGCRWWRDHVTLNIRKHPRQYRIGIVAGEKDYSYMRWTVDTAEDLDFARMIYGYFKDNDFGWEDVLQLLERNPKWVIKDTAID